VTGGSGFLGSHLVDLLLRQGYQVTVLDRVPETGGSHSGAIRVLCDVLDSDAVEQGLLEARPEVIFHMAGLTRGDDLDFLLAVNRDGTRAVLDAAMSLQERPTVVIPGSAAEYGAPYDDAHPISEAVPVKPLSNYGVSKAAQTLLGQSYAMRGDVPVIIGRIFNVTGPREPRAMLVSAVAAQIADSEIGLRPPVLQVGDLSPIRDYLDARDAAQALMDLAQHGTPGEIYNVSSGRPRLVEEIVRALMAQSKVPMTMEPDPLRQRPSEIPYSVGDPGKLRAATGWSPAIELEASLADTLAWWRSPHASSAALG
jgi:GDP-4-dehydro-6-deoxy-D-mannose reductase